MGDTGGVDTIQIIVPLFIAGAGVAFFIGVVALLVGALSRWSRLNIVFGILCLPIAGFLVSSAQFYISDSVDEAALTLRAQSFFVLTAFPLYFWFVALYTRQRQYVPWLLAVTAFFAVLAAVSVTLPYGMRFDSLESDEPLRLPWGETLSYYKTSLSPWQVPVRLATTGIFLWSLWRSIVQFRNGRRRAAAMLMIYVIVQYATIVAGHLVDMGVIRGIYLSGFGFLSLILLMSVSLGLDLRDRSMVLEDTTGKLQDEVELRRKVEEKLRHIAYHDDVTGLRNRVWLRERVTELIQRCRRTGECGSLLFLDLDQFKTINDSLGHAVGDTLLRNIASRINLVLPEKDMVIRTGGDEFVILPPVAKDAGRAAATARRTADNIMTVLREPFALGERRIYLGASVGIVLFPEDGNEQEGDLLRKAETALYQAKRSGRNKVSFFVPRMQEDATRRYELDRALHEACRAQSAELALHYQPQFDREGGVMGAEALLRWHHPQMGHVSSSEFIPVAEECGLIHQIGELVLMQACQMLNTWRQTSVPFTGHLSINVSPWELVRTDYPSQVERALRAHGVDPSRLTLEITESALLQKSPQVMENLKLLHSIGVGLAIDDFGVGYSSLAYLKQFPVDMLKIDRLFVQDIGGTQIDPLVRVIADIGRELDIIIIAEGVETETQKAALLSVGCDGLQGYLLCHPLSQVEFPDWLAGYVRKNEKRSGGQR